MSKVNGEGRLGNIIIRNLAGTIIAKKHNLQITYQQYDFINQIGIQLYTGTQIYEKQKRVNEANYFQILNKDEIDFNIEIVKSYCQTKQITDEIYKYLNSTENIQHFVNNNKYKDRYNNNNDCYIHIRLGDMKDWNPGFKYYNYVLSNLKYDNIYISTEDNDHIIIKNIQNNYKNVYIMNNDLIDIFKFASTCKYVILSYGTFSALIGYLSFYSNVYCLKFCKKTAWDWNKSCDMFRDKSTKLNKWTEVDI
tara:strand:+ start:28 stop:780 length:753 start_codon:yes stop_codon:yes gene_type:complete